MAKSRTTVCFCGQCLTTRIGAPSPGKRDKQLKCRHCQQTTTHYAIGNTPEPAEETASAMLARWRRDKTGDCITRGIEEFLGLYDRLGWVVELGCESIPPNRAGLPMVSMVDIDRKTIRISKTCQGTQLLYQLAEIWDFSIAPVRVFRGFVYPRRAGAWVFERPVQNRLDETQEVALAVYGSGFTYGERG